MEITPAPQLPCPSTGTTRRLVLPHLLEALSGLHLMAHRVMNGRCLPFPVSLSTPGNLPGLTSQTNRLFSDLVSGFASGESWPKTGVLWLPFSRPWSPHLPRKQDLELLWGPRERSRDISVPEQCSQLRVAYFTRGSQGWTSTCAVSRGSGKSSRGGVHLCVCVCVCVCMYTVHTPVSNTKQGSASPSLVVLRTLHSQT